VKFSKSELALVALLELDDSKLLELCKSSGSEFEQAKRASESASTKMGRLYAAKVVLWVMVLPRNIVAKHLMMLRTLTSFPAPK